MFANNQLPYLFKNIERNPKQVNTPIILLTGLQLTRKAQAVYVGKERGYKIISTGDYIRNKCTELGIENSFNNVKKVAGDLLKFGEANFLSNVLKDSGGVLNNYKGIIIDSIKSINGAQFVKSNYKTVNIVAFLASYEFRLEHSQLRSRADDATSISDFDERDKKEISMGIAQLITFADYFLLASTVSHSRQQFRKILDHIEKNHG